MKRFPCVLFVALWSSTLVYFALYGRMVGLDGYEKSMRGTQTVQDAKRKDDFVTDSTIQISTKETPAKDCESKLSCHSDRPMLHLLGERHSGTNWIENHLKECFGDSVDIKLGYNRWKHWWQSDDLQVRHKDRKSVVVAQFRNVYQWTEAMRSVPHHSPAHFNMEWKDFVTKVWTMPRYGKDRAFEGATKDRTPKVECKLNFSPWEIIPCLEDGEFAVMKQSGSSAPVRARYEMKNDGSGKPFKNILELRAAKIKNFLAVQHFANVKKFHITRYEEMVSNGTRSLIEALERDLGVSAKCNPIDGKYKEPYPFPHGYVKHMKEHVDWEAESLIGYKPSQLY